VSWQTALNPRSDCFCCRSAACWPQPVRGRTLEKIIALKIYLRRFYPGGHLVKILEVCVKSVFQSDHGNLNRSLETGSGVFNYNAKQVYTEQSSQLSSSP